MNRGIGKILARFSEKKEETDHEKLKRLAETHQGKIVNDSQYGNVVHVSPFHCVTKDGVDIWEWP